MPSIGSPAPKFQLPQKPGDVVDVGALIGKEKVVLLFIPLAFSSVCTAELCHFRDSWQQWESIGAKVFAISIDSPFVVAKFREIERIPFPVLSDFNKSVAPQYDALHADLMGLKGVEHGARIFSQPTCHHRPEVYGGMGDEAAAALLKTFFAARRES